MLSLGISLFVAANVVYTWTVLNSAYAGGDWMDALWLTAFAIFAFAGASQPTLTGEASVEDERAVGPSALAVPYAAVVVVFALLVGSQAGDSFFPGLSLTLTAMLIASLVLVRTYLAQRQLRKANAELRVAHAELAAIATTDPLTALPNHRALVDAIDRELERARRYERSCSLLFVDIDYFKALNDGCGHAAGDTVLRELGEVMRRSLRKVDSLGRWGGEEFVVVLPEVDAEAAMQTAERLPATAAEHLERLGERNQIENLRTQAQRSWKAPLSR